MAVNPREDRGNHHTIVIGQSGSGKTYWLQRHPWVRRRGGRLLVWDPYESHRAHYAGSGGEFARHLAGALRSGKGFRLALSTHPTPQAFANFCRCAWAALDGHRDTVILVEEGADVMRPGKASAEWGRLIRVGRKFGAVIMVTTQRPQEIDKTLFSQVSRKWCGYVSAYDRAYCEKHLGLDRGSLATIAPGSYQFAYVNGAAVSWGGPGRRAVKV